MPRSSFWNPLGGFAFFKRGYHLHALFKNVQELKVGDPVKMAGVRIGRVDGINLTNRVVRVTMNLQPGRRCQSGQQSHHQIHRPDGAKFRGHRFRQVRAAPRPTTASLQSVEQPDLSALMTKLDNVASGVENLTKSFSGEKIDNLLGPFTDFLKNNQANLTATIGNIKTVSDRIAEGKGTVGRLINEDTLYVSALNTVSNLQGTATDIQECGR